MVTFLILLLFAVIFLVAGGALLYFRSRNERKAALMGQTETSNASDVSGLAPGTLVEVKGTLRCEEPLVSDMAKTRCAYYLSTVTREYLESDYGDDDDVGSDRRSETLSQNEQVAPFAVEDATGSVAVAAEGAEVDAKQVVNRFERDASGLSIAGIPVRVGGGERTLGYRYTESILPVDAPVYVLGVVRENGEIGAPPAEDKEGRFLISYRSEEQLEKKYKRDALWLGLIALGLFVFGAVFVAISMAA